MNFDFFFKFPIPKPNKERLIIERNELGQIVKTKVTNFTQFIS